MTYWWILYDLFIFAVTATIVYLYYRIFIITKNDSYGIARTS